MTICGTYIDRPEERPLYLYEIKELENDELVRIVLMTLCYYHHYDDTNFPPSHECIDDELQDLLDLLKHHAGDKESIQRVIDTWKIADKVQINTDELVKQIWRSRQIVKKRGVSKGYMTCPVEILKSIEELKEELPTKFTKAEIAELEREVYKIEFEEVQGSLYRMDEMICRITDSKLDFELLLFVVKLRKHLEGKIEKIHKAILDRKIELDKNGWKPSNIPNPSKIDWRTHNGNYVTPVKNQDKCPACSAFAVTATLESRIQILGQSPVTLSDGQLFFCGRGSSTCDGISIEGALDYCKNPGIAPDFSYPKPSCPCPKEKCPLSFLSKPCSLSGNCQLQNCLEEWAKKQKHCPYLGKCPYLDFDFDFDLEEFVVECPLSPPCPVDWKNKVSQPHKVVTSHSIKSSVKDMKLWLDKDGPLVTILYIYADFQRYTTGVYRRKSNNRMRIPHAVCCIGYDDTEECWICKNSWGEDWGDKGYFKIGYGECGIDVCMWAIDDVI